MASGVKFGSKIIPIVATVELTGSPPSQNQASSAAITAAKAAVNLNDIVSNGVAMYMGLNGFSPDGALETYAYFHSGSTALLGDGGNVLVGEPKHASTAYSTMSTSISLQHSGEEISLGSFTSNFGYTGYTNYSDDDYQSLVAVRYHYPNAAEEAQRRYGYIFISAYQRHRVARDGSETITTNFGNTCYYSFPEINKRHSWDIYYEEQPMPDPEDDPNDEGEPSDEEGGDGDHTPIYDPIPIPSKPTMGAANAGFLTMYKLGLSAINQFASDMFAGSVWEAIKLFFSNPIDFMVGCMLLPFEPSTGSSYKPKFGLVSFEHAYPAVDDQYKDIDCGSVTISKYWGSAFDYEPYTKIQIWLPYIGYRDLPVDEIMDMTIGVKYRCDCLTGDCVAFVSTGVVGESGPQIPRVIAQFYGNCGVRVPFGSVSFDAAVAAGINLIGAAATMGLSSGAGSIVTGAEGGTAVDEGFSSPSSGGLVNAAIGVVSGMKPNVQKGGAAGASTGYMSIQTPYLIRRIPRQNLPSNYMNLKGYPSNIGGKLSDFSGLAVVDDIQLNDIPAMEDERREIMKWLSGGVII